MMSWSEFVLAAPTVAEIFERRCVAADNLCMLGTVRADGSPRISPMEPRIFEDRLWIIGMPGTRKFGDLAADPRFCLHSATVSTHPTDGDAKLSGRVHHIPDREQQQRFAEHLFTLIGLDIRGQEFESFYAADITSASPVQLVDGHLDITVWTAGLSERTVRKY